MLHPLPALWPAALAITASLASAQTAPPPPTTVPAFRSAMEGYRPFADQALAPWRESNDTVGRIGGWRAYAGEAQRAAPGAQPAGRAAPPSPGTPAAAPVEPHGGHKH